MTMSINSSSCRRFLSTAAAVRSSNNRCSIKSTIPRSAPWLVQQNENDDAVPRFANFINGSFVTPPPLKNNSSNNTEDIPLYDPSTNDLLSTVPNSSHTVVQEAVYAAKTAYATWSTTPVQVRQRLLAEYAHLLQQVHIREEIA
jgi:malonate-semialdehyde dehydrogenase (acetylating)/methylmalonate-semialdehyde dehydrogenase